MISPPSISAPGAPACIFFKQLLAKDEEKRISIKTALEPVAEALGNTPAISRKSYVHPTLIHVLEEDPRDPLDGFEPSTARDAACRTPKPPSWPS